MIHYLSKAIPRAKRVLVRADLNVPIRGRRVLDAFDIVRVLPIIQKLIRRGNRVIILSHHSDERQSLAPLVPHLTRMLGRRVTFLRDLSGPRARRRVRSAGPGAVFLGENVRFWRGERRASSSFARSLAALGEVFVNDAFGELHRPYASMIGIPRYLPSFAGPLIASELKMLDRFIRRPARPLVGVFGGAKMETKLPILRRFSRFADQVLVGGGVANTLLRARGFAIGRSLSAPMSAAIRRLARSEKIVLPIDVVVVRTTQYRNIPVTLVEPRDRIVDIGPKTQARFQRILGSARTVVWNGPLGLAEEKRYAGGTLAVARALARHRGSVLVGGGDTVAFLGRTRLLARFKYVSTGGGAMLAYLAGEKLPGLEALKR
ncbi:MAG: phosphoglycerate kinase [bacterium]|nr:phosphoglycerate kinase [bacterium]